MLFNKIMKTIEQTRIERLYILIGEYGSAANLARALGVQDSQLNQWKKAHKESSTGKPRGMRNDSARMIEEKTGKPRGWMDQPVYDASDKEINEAIELIKALPRYQLHKVEEIVNLVCEPEAQKYGNGQDNNGNKK